MKYRSVADEYRSVISRKSHIEHAVGLIVSEETGINECDINVNGMDAEMRLSLFLWQDWFEVDDKVREGLVSARRRLRVLGFLSTKFMFVPFVELCPDKEAA